MTVQKKILLTKSTNRKDFKFILLICTISTKTLDNIKRLIYIALINTLNRENKMKNILANRENKSLKVGSYDYQGLAHWYFYNNGMKQTAYDKMSCEYNKVYSYQTCVGQLHENKKGEILFLITNKKYSLTTSRQISCLLNASHHQYLFVDNVGTWSRQTHIENLQKLYNEVLSLSGKASRARAQHMITSYLTQASNKINTINIYCNFFKLKNTSVYKTINGKQFDATALSKLAHDAEQKKRKKFIKQKKSFANRIYKAWINNELVKNENNKLIRVTSQNLMLHNDVNNYNIIRLVGNTIETSLGTTIKLKHARKWFDKLLNNELKVGQSIDGFEIKTITNDHIKIGCTTLSIKQITEILT